MIKAIEVKGLSKSYSGAKNAVDNITFTINEGEVFGFLGPNGAGKTTTVKLLNGMLDPTGGTMRVHGIDPAAKPVEIHKISGVLTELAQMYGNMTGLANLIFYGSIFGIRQDECKRNALELLETLGLSNDADKPLNAYSTGMRQRLSLARALIHSPKVLFLDEPTAGLDPESAMSVNNLITGLARERGITVFLCTHQLRYAQEICTKYGLIDEGSLLALGDIDALRSMVFSGLKVSIRADGYPAGTMVKRTKDGGYEIDVQSEDEIALIVRRIVEGGGKVYHVSARRLSLEEIYFKLIERRKPSGKGEAI